MPAPKAPQKPPEPWMPKDKREAEARAAGLPYVGLDGQMYQDQENPADQAQEQQPPAAAADPAPPSLAPVETKKAIEGSPHNPSQDSVELDSLGNPKSDTGPVGPRGKEVPPDVLTPEEKAKRQAAQEARLARGMSSTARTDSVGNLKGNFEDAKKRSEDNRVEEEHHLVGPRGKGAINADTYHGPRPVKKS